jgi:hypothetical protein
VKFRGGEEEELFEGTPLQYLWIVWLVSSLSLARVFVYVLAYRSRMIAKPTRERFGTPSIIFQITTKGNIPIVQESVNRVNTRNTKFGSYQMCVKNLKTAERSWFLKVSLAMQFTRAELFSTQWKFARLKRKTMKTYISSTLTTKA